MRLFNRFFIAAIGEPNKVPPNRSSIIETDLNADIRRGDIVLYRVKPESLISAIISEISQSPYSHSEIHLYGGYDISAESNGVGFIDLYKSCLENNVDIFRFPNLTREQGLAIQAKAMQSIATPYDYENLFKFKFATSKEIAQFAGNQAYICSELVAWVFSEAGINLIKDKPTSITSPADLAKSTVIEYVGTYEKGKKLSDNLKNIFLNKEKNELAQSIGGFINSIADIVKAFREGIEKNRSKMNG